jgi:Lrp/AsnC family transcriptional regulator, regulator for asnA, asnC and gidA
VILCRYSSSTNGKVSKIDKLDLNIIKYLQDDGNLTNTEIAVRLGISEATVRRRRAQLQEDDVIRVVAVANPFKLGFRIMTIIGIQVEQSVLREVEQSLVGLPDVRFLGITLGEYDLMLEAWFKSNDDLLHFVTFTLTQIPGIKRTESFQILHLSKYTYDWGTPTAARQILIEGTQLGEA